MIKKNYYKACSLFITSPYEKKKDEYFNDYGYNLSKNDNKIGHYEAFSKTTNSSKSK